MGGYLNSGQTASFDQISGNRGWLKTGSLYVQAALIGINPGNTNLRTGTATQKIYLRETPPSTATYFATYNMGSKVVILDSTSVSGWVRVGTQSGIGWIESYSVDID